jgi:hypothetical protein
LFLLQDEKDESDHSDRKIKKQKTWNFNWIEKRSGQIYLPQHPTNSKVYHKHTT